jgi:dTDP-4-dehydrorhamnose 3,5-epimerase
MGTLKVLTTRIDGVVLVETQRREDQRGTFARLFCDEELAPVVGSRRIVQINHSITIAPGTVRGLHFQYPPHAEMKLVRCLRGRVWDVAVDLRAGSPTFLQWHAQELTPGNGLMLVIPEGCAHGFQALEADSELYYLCTAGYLPASEGGLHCRDPRLGIRWPLPVGGLSPRDEQQALIEPDFAGMTL